MWERQPTQKVKPCYDISEKNHNFLEKFKSRLLPSPPLYFFCFFVANVCHHHRPSKPHKMVQGYDVMTLKRNHSFSKSIECSKHSISINQTPPRSILHPGIDTWDAYYTRVILNPSRQQLVPRALRSDSRMRPPLSSEVRRPFRSFVQPFFFSSSRLKKNPRGNGGKKALTT